MCLRVFGIIFTPNLHRPHADIAYTIKRGNVVCAFGSKSACRELQVASFPLRSVLTFLRSICPCDNKIRLELLLLCSVCERELRRLQAKEEAVEGRRTDKRITWQCKFVHPQFPSHHNQRWTSLVAVSFCERPNPYWLFEPWGRWRL